MQDRLLQALSRACKGDLARVAHALLYQFNVINKPHAGEHAPSCHCSQVFDSQILCCRYTFKDKWLLRQVNQLLFPCDHGIVN